MTDPLRAALCAALQRDAQASRDVDAVTAPSWLGERPRCQWSGIRLDSAATPYAQVVEVCTMPSGHEGLHSFERYHAAQAVAPSEGDTCRGPECARCRERECRRIAMRSSA